MNVTLNISNKMKDERNLFKLKSYNFHFVFVFKEFCLHELRNEKFLNFQSIKIWKLRNAEQAKLSFISRKFLKKVLFSTS